MPFEKGNKPWNLGKTKENNPILKKISGALKGKPSNSNGRGKTPEREKSRKDKISKRMKIVGGGYRQGSGRGKKGRYKGIWCDSSWELAWVIYNLENGVSFCRNLKKFAYTYRHRKKFYIPDFFLNESKEYIEIKGYKTFQFEQKMLQFKFPLKVIGKNEINRYLDYAIEKYGKNFIKLYDEKDKGRVDPSGAGSSLENW